MIKENKLKLIISSLIILLPTLFGIAMWDKLPATMPIHFNFEGKADGYASKPFAVFVLPLILVGLQFLGLLVTSLDKRQKDQNKKALAMIFWIVPVISVFVNSLMYAKTLENDIDINAIIPLILGVVFVWIGNYMPKIKPNCTLGIKIPTTLKNDENWFATHRFTGKIWVVGGIVIIISTLLPSVLKFIVMGVAFVVLLLAPIIFSCRFEKNQ